MRRLRRIALSLERGRRSIKEIAGGGEEVRSWIAGWVVLCVDLWLDFCGFGERAFDLREMLGLLSQSL